MPKEKKKKYPEVWYIFDGAEDYLGYLADNPEDKDPDLMHLMINGRHNPYLAEMVWTLYPLGKEVYELPDHVDGEPGGYMIGPVEKEVALDMITDNMGFMARKATDDDHDEVIREMDKLKTIKGGESKRYSRAKS